VGGFSSVVQRAWVPTFERYADVSVASTANYTPAVPGFFSPGTNLGSGFKTLTDATSSDSFSVRFYSSGLGAVVYLRGGDYTAEQFHGFVIGDGANLRFNNRDTVAAQLVLMRMG